MVPMVKLPSHRNAQKNSMKRAHYETLRAQDRDYWWFRTRHDVVLRFLRLQRQGPLLDVGCGAGGFLRRCLDDKIRSIDDVLGLDLDPESVATASARGIPAQVMPPDDLRSIVNCQPSAITMLDVMEHIEDPIPLLKEIRSVSASDTMLIVLVPAIRALWSPWDDRLGHFRRYDRHLVRKTLKQAGWKVQHTRYLFPSMVLPGLLRAKMLRADALPADEFPVVSPSVNRILHAVTSMESRVSCWPIGSSLAAVARPDN